MSSRTVPRSAEGSALSGREAFRWGSRFQRGSKARSAVIGSSPCDSDYPCPPLTLQRAVHPAQPAPHLPKDLRRDRGICAEDLCELLPQEQQAPERGGSDDARGPGSAVQKRDLSEEVTWPQGIDRPASSHHAGLPLEDHEEGVATSAFLGHGRALRVLVFLGHGQELAEFAA